MSFLRKNWTHGLRFRLMAPFIVGLVCLTVFLVLYTYRSARHAVEQGVLTVCQAKTEHTLDTLALLIKGLRSKGQDLVIDQELIHVLRIHDQGHLTENSAHDIRKFLERISRRLKTMTEEYRYFRDILLLDRNAVCIASSNEGYIDTNFSDQDYIQQVLQGHYYIGNFSIGRVTKTFTTYFAAPINVGRGFEGILIIINDFPGIVENDITSNIINGIISIKMLAPDGIYTAHDDITIMGNKNLDFRKIYQQLLPVSERGGIVEYSENGQKYIGYAHIEPNTQWIIVTSGLKGDVFEPAYSIGQTVFAVTYLVFFLVIMVVLSNISDILKVLFDLIHFAKEVAAGNLARRLGKTTRKDELGILHNSLDNLVTTLQNTVRERQEADKMKDEFLANMSHEIRTPLNAVIGLTHLANQEGIAPDKQREYLEHIKISAEFLLRIINDILDISKLEAGKMTVESQPFALQTLLEDTLSLHHEAAQAKGLQLISSCEASVHTRYVGDAMRLKQILHNLLSNAIKFTNTGEIRLSCREEPLEEDTPKQVRLYVRVSDTGIGIPSHVASRLFRPFTQGDASVTRHFGGTGLGLAICRSLVTLMGGEIWLESMPEKGSAFTFYITLPVAEEKDEEIPDKSENATQSQEDKLEVQGRRILLAEDNAINQMIFKELLAPFEAELCIVNNGKEAVEAVQKTAFHLILMDIQMPVMGGFEATRIIRSLDNGKDCPIIALTANVRVETQKDAIALGMNDYQVKPINPALFEETVKKWLKAGQSSR